MKKYLLLALTFGFIAATWAQPGPELRSDVNVHFAPSPEKIGIEMVKSPSVTQSKTPAPYISDTRDVNYVTIIDIGTSANAYGYGYGGGQKALVWVNNDLNVVTNFHRMGGDLDPGGYSGDLGYDISFDGGMTWTNMVEVYISNISGGTYNIDAARYPNHGVYNPMGNTDPDEAYITWFAPTLDASNGDSWGGNTWGRAKIGDIEDTTKHLASTDPPFFLYIPDAFDISQELGVVIAVDVNQDWSSGTVEYQGNLIVNRGEWNDGIMDFEYTKELLDCPTLDNQRPTHAKFAFGPDGETGWICVISNSGEITPISGLNYYYPILFQTTDGGETWSDPISVQLDGPDGIPEVLEYLTDDQIAALFEPPLPARDEIPYTTAFDCDLAVDQNGNPHIAVVIGVGGSDEYSIVTETEAFAAFDIFSKDGGETWHGFNCGNLKLFRGYFPDNTYSEDNRIQIASTEDGHYMFVGWLDTWLEGATDNNSPDIFCRGIEVNYGSPFRYSVNEEGDPVQDYVTYFSEGMWQSYFFGMSRYALEDGEGNITIPFTYQSMDPLDPAVAVQFKYVQDFMYNVDEDFLIVGVDEKELSSISSVSQNYPNPFSGTTNIAATLDQKADLSLEVTNLTGQQVIVLERGLVSPGTYYFQLNAEDLTPGIYFYTVTANDHKVTRKMIVK
jgi:hypothetical protein